MIVSLIAGQLSYRSAHLSVTHGPDSIWVEQTNVWYLLERAKNRTGQSSQFINGSPKEILIAVINFSPWQVTAHCVVSVRFDNRLAFDGFGIRVEQKNVDDFKDNYVCLCGFFFG